MRVFYASLLLVGLSLNFAYAEKCDDGLKLVEPVNTNEVPRRPLVQRVVHPNETKSLVLIDRVLATAIKHGASDVHINIGQPPGLGLHGEIVALNTKVVTSADAVAVMKAITPEHHLQEFHENGTADFSFSFMGHRFRVSLMRTQGDIGLVLRLIQNNIMTMDQIGLPSSVQEIITKRQGLFLVTGPTSSGKSTTLASMIQAVNERFRLHILTLEDPVEYVFSDAQAYVTQREVGEGNDVPSFYEGIWRGLRAAPNVIFVGEMRERETIEAALRAANTGHLVVSTLHSNTAASAFNRIVDEIEDDNKSRVRALLAELTIGVINQRLVRRPGGKGRVAAFEVLHMTSAIKNHVRRGDSDTHIESAMQMGRDTGMQLLDDELYRLILEGEADAEDAISWAIDGERLRQRLSRP